MSVPAFNNNPGIYARSKLTEYAWWGAYKNGQFLEHHSWDAYQSDYVFRANTNKSPSRRVGGPRKCKDYSRGIQKVTECRGYRWSERSSGNYGNWDYLQPLIGSTDPRKPGWYNEWGQDIDAAARTKVLNKLRGDKENPTLQLGADLGESKKTVQMVADASTTLLKAVIAAKNGKWGNIPRILKMNKGDVLTGKFGANKWLEYQYGWTPLMGTIYDGSQLIHDGFKKIPPPNMWALVRSGEKREYNEVIPSDTQEIRVDGYIQVVYGLYYRVSSETLAKLDTIGLINPASVAWELVPFSFVLDWFIPVGQTLSALSATAGLEFVDGYRMERRHLRERMTHKPFDVRGADDYHAYQTDGGQWTSEAFYLYRSALNSFPTPGLFTNPNPFKTDLRVKNALALLRQLL